jgi:hypothetical protein
LASDASFKPGQAPVQKDTGELESILPQWLKDARESAKQTESPVEPPKRKEEPPAKPAASSMDFLASLQSQTEDEDDEEVPDWLASITGSTSKPKTDETETSGSRWVETGRKDDFQQDAPEEEVPSWLSGLQTPQTGAEEKDELTDWFRESGGEGQSFQQPFTPVPQEPAAFDSSFAAPTSNDTPDWLKQMAADAGEQQPEETPAESSFGSSDWFTQMPADSNAAPQTPAAQPFDFSADTPDWLNQLQADANAAPQAQAPEPFNLPSDTPDWLNQLQSDSNAAPQGQTPEPFNASSDTPDWLNQLPTGSASSQAQEPEPFSLSADTPDWLNQIPADSNAAPQASEPFSLPSDLPDWLNQMQADSNAAPQAQTPEPFNVSSDAPDWLNQISADATAAPQAETPELPDTSDWLSSLSGISGEAAAPFAESEPAESEPFASSGDIPSWMAPPAQDASKKVDSTPRWLQSEGDPSATTPAWLASNEKTIVSPERSDEPAQDDLLGDLPDWLKSAAPTSIFDEPAQAAETPKVEEPPLSSTFESAPAFSEDAFPAGNDALFSEMPDWLSNAMETPPAATMVPEPITGSDALAPDVLPSWVEAMRPSDQGMANIVALASDKTLESRGALAGLSGVLPLGSGFTPTSKPKAYSIKLNASEEQLKHAGILEQILAAETAPESLASEKTLTASRGLRWALAFILLAVALATTFTRTQIFSTPLLPPNELKLAVAVAQAIPENAPVLVAVDYEPSRAGEMEAAAAPLFDNLLLLKHPRLTFVASNENGAILAERFITGPLAVHNYQSGVTYLNLGYLSGGQMGIRAFAQNPASAAPLDIFSQPAWTSAPLQGVTALNQFGLIILITDDAGAARSWVEQTQTSRGAVPVIVISSAQSAPMIQPYYESGQVAGMISGLYGGAILEQQYNNGRPGMARNYWDAYSIGMLLAMVLVLGGGLFNMAMGLRERSANGEGK